MPLAEEVQYWEQASKKQIGDGEFISDNVWKRPHQIRRLLKYDWIGERVLEIGIGNAMIAGALTVIVQRAWHYTGTELSGNFIRAAKSRFQLNAVQADVRELPGSGYTRILALDSLEHVRPEQRAEGYAKIASVAARDALLFIHFSRSVSCHDKRFDHPFGLRDLVALEDAGFVLGNYERYSCPHPNVGALDYVFVVMKYERAPADAVG